MARDRARRRARRAGDVSPVAAVFMPGEQADVERLRAGAYTRWQNEYRGKAVKATALTADLPAWLAVPDTRPGRDDEFYSRHYVNADDRRAPRPTAAPFTKTCRKAEGAGPMATSTGFNTRL